MARDGVGQSGAQHYELVLALILGRAHSAANGVVQAAKLTFRAGIHVPHPAHDHVGLVVEIERVADQLVVIDLGRAFGPGAASFAPSLAAAFPSTAAIVSAVV